MKMNKGQMLTIFASGNIVHNLGFMSWHKPEFGYDWAFEFDKKVVDLIEK